MDEDNINHHRRKRKIYNNGKQRHRTLQIQIPDIQPDEIFDEHIEDFDNFDNNLVSSAICNDAERG